MALQEILDYLNQNPSYSDDQLKNALLESGHSETDINDALHEFRSVSPIPSANSSNKKPKIIIIIVIVVVLLSGAGAFLFLGNLDLGTIFSGAGLVQGSENISVTNVIGYFTDTPSEESKYPGKISFNLSNLMTEDVMFTSLHIYAKLGHMCDYDLSKSTTKFFDPPARLNPGKEDFVAFTNCDFLKNGIIAGESSTIRLGATYSLDSGDSITENMDILIDINP